MSQLSFRYQAIDRRGTRRRGVLRAENQNEAFRQMRAAGLQPVRLRAVRARESRRKKVTIKDLAQFTYQFAVLMEARIPIVEGLRSIAEQEQNPALRVLIADVADRIAGGSNVTSALSAHREILGEVYVESVRAAERSGTMIEVLTNLAEMLDRQHDMQKGVKAALMYPACVIGALGLAVVFLMLFVVPRFATMFASRGLELPMPTQVLIGISGFITSYWYVLLSGLVVAVLLARRAWRRPSSRRQLDTLLHRIPFIRDMLRGLAISRFAQVLGISLRSGLSLLDALEMAGRASARPLLLEDAEKMREQVNHGGRLADVLLTCSYVPPFTRRMLSAGEEAAELPRMCTVVSRHYDREVTHLTKNVTTVIEPIMIVGLAGIVLLVALAIFLPMWNMAALVG